MTSTDAKLVLDLFEVERGRPVADTVELLRFVLDLRSRHGWKTLPEVLERLKQRH
jgi:hypothetical protein